jgi:hypothetical protein
MTRGQIAPDGSTRTAPNGYHYTKEHGEWRLTHHIIAEKEILKRPLRKGERVSFGKGGKSVLKASNIIVTAAGKSSARRRIAILEARQEEIEAELKDLRKELEL